MDSRAHRIIQMAFAVIVIHCASSSATVHYVAPNGDNTTGQNWATAFTSIEAALASASVTTGDEIRIKQGTYSIASSIHVSKAVSLYGGYHGVGDTRDPQTYVSIIDGGGSVIHCFYVSADATIDGLTITGGYSTGTIPDDEGGGMYIDNCDPTLNRCAFLDNYAEYRGGAISAHFADDCVITNCTFSRNATGSQGGAVYGYDSDVTIAQCTFESNEGTTGASTSGGGIYTRNSAPAITQCTFTGNRATRGAGVCNASSDAVITNCTFADCNATSSDGGGVYNSASSVTIENCLFTGNRVVSGGGAIYDAGGTGPDDVYESMVVNCIMAHNEAATYGGAVRTDSYLTTKFTNCTIYGNSANNRGGAVFNGYGEPTFTNCVVWGNTAPTGPGMYNYSATPGFQMFANHSDIQGGFPGTNNIEAEPNFVDPNQGYFQLTSGSYCIDAGDDLAPGIASTDYAGDPRIVDGNDNGTARVDMGAYEYQNLAAFTIGGFVYADVNDPSTSGVVGVTVTVSGTGEALQATTVGPQGFWEIADVNEGGYTVTPSKTGYTFQHVGEGGPDGQPSVAIEVNESNQVANRNIAFLAELTVRPHDWNGDGIVSIVGDVPPFVNCVYFQSCPDGVDTIAVGDCNDDGILSIVGDVPCFVDCVYFGNCLQ